MIFKTTRWLMMCFALITALSFTANAQVFLSEGFEAGLPAGWTNSGMSSTTALPCSGTGAVRDNLYSFSTTGTYTSPDLSGSNATDVTFSFDYKIVEYNFSNPSTPQTGDWGTIAVEYSTDGGTTFTTLETIDQSNHTTSASCASKSYTIPGASVPSTIQVRWSSTQNSGDWYFYLDDVSVSQAGGCNPPSALTATATGLTTVDVTFVDNAGAQTFNVEYTAAGAGQGTGTTTSFSGSPAMITGLTASTSYDFYVQADCGGSQSSWAGPITETTISPPPVNDLCANAIDLGTLTSPFSGTTEGASDDDLQSCAGGNTSPDIYFKIDVADGESLTIGQTTNGYDSENYIGYGGTCGELNAIACYDDPDTETTTWQNCTGSTQTVIWVQDGYSSATHAGTFTLAWSVTPAAIASCLTADSPADAAVDVATSGDITWSAAAGACSYDVYLDQTATPTTLLGNTTSLTMAYSGLANGATYNVLIVPVNSAGSPTGCATTSFTTINTPPICTSISSPADASVNIAIDGTITFASAMGANSYDVYLDVNATPTTLLGNTSTTSIAFSGLLNATVYYVQIVPKNAVGSATGCPITSFTTVDAPPPNNDCANAEALTCGSTTAGTSILASGDAAGTGCSVGPGVWYTFTGTGFDMTVLVDAITSSFDHEIAIASGSCGTFVNIGCSDSGFGGGDETITFSSDAGVTYYLYVGAYSSFGGGEGTFDVTVTCDDPAVAAAAGCTGTLTETVDGSGSPAVVHFIDANGDLYASIGNTQNLGSVAVSLYGGASRQTGAGDHYLNRNVAIVPTTQPTAAVNVTVYATNAEVTALINASQIAGNPVNSVNDMQFVKVAGTASCSPTYPGGATPVSIGATPYGTDWAFTGSVSTFSEFFVLPSAAPLPVELSSFTAYPAAEGNRVEWTAASEIDLYMYTVERATNPASFSAFADVAPKGTDFSEAVYASEDLNPATTTYYRLRIEDLDGTVDYSDVVAVTRDDVKGGISMFPNPAHDKVTFEILPGTIQDDNVSVVLTDLSGRIVREWNLATNQRTDVSVSDIPSGVYMVSAVSANGIESQRLVID